MTNFLGFKQVTKVAYDALSSAEKKQYMWFVREIEGNVVKHSAIYFGTRLYAEVNEDAAEKQHVENIIASLGSMVDETGAWQGFSPFDDHTLLFGKANTTEALSALEAAIVAANKALDAEASARTKADKELKELIESVSGQTIKSINIIQGNGNRGANSPFIAIYNDEGLVSKVDASEFVVDGMLSAVTYDASAHTITFTWNTDGGAKSTTIDLDDVMQPVVADEKTLHAEVVNGKNQFSAIMDETDGVASFEALNAVSAATKELVKETIEALDSEASADNTGVKVEVAITDGKLNGVTVDATELINEASAATVAVENELLAFSAATVEAIEAEAEARKADDNAIKADVTELEARIIDLEDKLAAEIELHVITGDDVEGYEGNEEEEVTANKLSALASSANGGSMVMPVDVTASTLIKK